MSILLAAAAGACLSWSLLSTT